MFTPVNPSFTLLKWGLRGSELYRHVLVMDIKVSRSHRNKIIYYNEEIFKSWKPMKCAQKHGKQIHCIYDVPNIRDRDDIRESTTYFAVKKKQQQKKQNIKTKF